MVHLAWQFSCHCVTSDASAEPGLELPSVDNYRHECFCARWHELTAGTTHGALLVADDVHHSCSLLSQ